MTARSHRSVSPLAALTADFQTEQEQLAQGGGPAAIERQHAKGRLTPASGSSGWWTPAPRGLELGLWCRLADVRRVRRRTGGRRGVRRSGTIAGRRQMIIANDATVKAGAFFPATAKKVLRAQRIAMQNRLPLVYLVDSAGVFLPLQEDVFPDEDDFGRIFRNNAVISAAGLGQIAAIMGNCVAGGGYLPVLCDKLLMTDGSGLYLAGPALVKSAIGQEVSSEELGGAEMHAQVSGTIDYRDPNDEACLERLRRLAAAVRARPGRSRRRRYPRSRPRQPARPGERSLRARQPRSARRLRSPRRARLPLSMPAASTNTSPSMARSLVCGTARLGGFPIGIVANQHHRVRPAEGPIQFGGVLYVDSAEKAARFVMNCNQDWLPIVFLQDVNGFMVGRDSERSGIIKAGAKLVSAISNSRVPKLTVIVGGSFGAGNYALCGKAFDPRLIFAWPAARCAVMGAEQATSTLLDITVKSLERQGHAVDAAGTGRTARPSEGRLRSADRRPLRSGPGLGRRDSRPGRNPRRADPRPWKSPRGTPSRAVQLGVFQV